MTLEKLQLVLERVLVDRVPKLGTKVFREGYFRFLGKSQKWIDNEGKQGLRRVKSLKQCVTNYVLYGELNVDQTLWTSTLPSGLPTILSFVPLGPYSPVEKQALLSLFSIDRLIISERMLEETLNESLLGITSPGPVMMKIPVKESLHRFLCPHGYGPDGVWDGNPAYKDSSPLGLAFQRWLVKSIELNPRLGVYSKFRTALDPTFGSLLSNKQGPNGRSVESAYADAYAVVTSKVYSHIKGFSKSLKPFLKGKGVELRTPFLDIVKQYVEGITASDRSLLESELSHKGRPPVSGRIAAFADKGGKNRVIAVGDQFTQTALRPIHEKLFDILRVIPQDCTFEQEKGVEALKDWTSGPGFVASLDLSSATDRFPVTLQVTVMTQVFNSLLANCWRQLLTEREFLDPRGRLIRYEVGQPMGILSSWAAFTLTHHLIIQFANFLATGSFKWFRGYRILGDDIVINSERVSEQYRMLMETMGVNISLAKSHISGKGTSRIPTGEFAKKIVQDGVDISPLSLSYFAAATKRSSDFLSLAITLRNSNIRTNLKALRSVIKALHPRGARTLDHILTTPQLWGGGGFNDHRSLPETLKEDSNYLSKLITAKLALSILRRVDNLSQTVEPDLSNLNVRQSLFRATIYDYPAVRTARVLYREMQDDSRSILGWSRGNPKQFINELCTDKMFLERVLNLVQFLPKSNAPSFSSVTDDARLDERLWAKAGKLARSQEVSLGLIDLQRVALVLKPGATPLSSGGSLPDEGRVPFLSEWMTLVLTNRKDDKA